MAASGTTKKKKKPISIFCTSTVLLELVQSLCEERGWMKTEDPKKAKLIWCASQDELATRLPLARPKQKFSKIPGMYFACSKIQLTLALETARRLFPEKYSFWPDSWLLPDDAESLYRDMEKNAKKKDTYIIKPDTGSQGDGIFLVTNYRDLQSKMMGRGSDYIVQRYVPNPLLLEGLKFDLRMYALVTSVEPLRVYLAREGLARFCTEKYSPPSAANLHKVTGHLTNYSLNVRSESFVHSNEPESITASKRTLSSVFQQLSDLGVDVQEIQEGINSVVVNTCLAMKPVLLDAILDLPSREGAEQCFQIIGFDILLDENLHPWLLEVNNGPSLAIDTVYTIDQFIEIHGRPAVEEALSRTSRVNAADRRRQLQREGAESLQLKACTCMDGSGSHFHEVCGVDLSVKLPVLDGAAQIVLRNFLPDSYLHICDGEVESVRGISMDLMSSVFHIFNAVVGVRRTLDQYRLHAFGKTIGISSKTSPSLYDLDMLLIKHKKLCAAYASRIGHREFGIILFEIAKKLFPADDLASAITRIIQIYFSAKTAVISSE